MPNVLVTWVLPEFIPFLCECHLVQKIHGSLNSYHFLLFILIRHYSFRLENPLRGHLIQAPASQQD